MVKAGTKQVIRAEKWVAEYRRWVGSGLTQRSYCGQVGLIFTQFKSGGGFGKRGDVWGDRLPCGYKKPLPSRFFNAILLH